MKGLVVAAGLSRRMQDLDAGANKVLLNLGDGKTLLSNLFDQFDAVGASPIYTTAGYDGAAVRDACRDRSTVLLNPFFEHYGVLSSLWAARPELYAAPFLLSVGDHYIEREAVVEFSKSQPEASILVQVELKKCDDEDMKVFINPRRELLTLSKTWPKKEGTAIGEFTGMVRFSSAGSRLFFDSLASLTWQAGAGPTLFIADVLMACHKREALAFHLSSDHRRMDVDFPSDYVKACDLYRTRPKQTTPAAEEVDAAAPYLEPTMARAA
ncbi:MAG: NTP transferase domain-containing protein [Planctomycetia bacterium]